MHLLPRMNVMLEFIGVGLVELRGTRNSRKFRNEKFFSPVGFEPMSGTAQIMKPPHYPQEQI